MGLVQLKDAGFVAGMDSSMAMEISVKIGARYRRGEVTSTNFLKSVAGVIVVLGSVPRNNILMQLRYVLMTEQLPRSVEDFVSDLCDKLDTLLIEETKVEEYRVKAELERARKDFYAVQAERYASEETSEKARAASVRAEMARKKAQQDLEDTDKTCLLL
jgi:hypothetical protein